MRMRIGDRRQKKEQRILLTGVGDVKREREREKQKRVEREKREVKPSCERT